MSTLAKSQIYYCSKSSGFVDKIAVNEISGRAG